MDSALAERIARSLDELNGDIVRRGEFLERTGTLEGKLDDALRQIGEQNGRLIAVATRVEVENRQEERRGTRRGWVVPSIVSAAGVVLNALLTALTLLAGGGGHSS